jgi:hypothetical protein
VERSVTAVSSSARLCQNLLLAVSPGFRQPLAFPGTLAARSTALCSRCPHDQPAHRHLSAEGGHQRGHLDAGQHPPAVVRQDRHPALRPPLCQPPHEAVARVPPPFHGPTRVRHPRLAPLHHLRPTPHPRRHRLQPRLIAPAPQPPSAWMARARRRERTARAGAADRPPGRTVVHATVGHHLGVGPERLQPPPPCDLARRLLLPAATRTEAVERASTVARQTSARGLARSPRRSRHGPWGAAGCAVECVDTGLEEAARSLLGQGVVEALGEEAHVVAVRPLEMAHGGTRRRDGQAASLPHWTC